MKRFQPLLLAALFPGIVACERAEPEPEISAVPAVEEPREARGETQPSECQERARGAVMSLKRGLMQRLSEALAESPAAAVDVCSREADVIRERVQRESGVQVGRASSRLRNHEANGSPPAWVRAYLNEHDGGGEAMEWTGHSEGEARVISPLIASELCLTCHGDDLAPPVLALIDEHYPNDEARGYHAGDLRGVVWAHVACD